MTMTRTHILVVDDEADLEALIRQKFRREIRESKYDFSFASNGEEAIAILKNNPEIGLVLSDINMPIMDGLTLLIKVNESNPLVKMVMVSAYGDMENIRSAMNNGAFDFVCKPVNFEDLGLTIEKTIKHIDHIRKTFEAIRQNNILRMYVDDNVLNFMSREEFQNTLCASETINGTVLFIDICGFTAISENEDPNFVVQFLNEYFDIIVKEVTLNGGVIDKFMGDCVMAVFKGDFHLDRAIDAGLAVRNKIDSIKEPVSGGLKEYLPKVSIGVNSGVMISGNIGAASLKRLDFTVIGDAVNVAQRLQAHAGESQILITQVAYEQIKDSFKCIEVGEVSFKNKSETIKCYEVLE